MMDGREIGLSSVGDEDGGEVSKTTLSAVDGVLVMTHT